MLHSFRLSLRCPCASTHFSRLICCKLRIIKGTMGPNTMYIEQNRFTCTPGVYRDNDCWRKMVLNDGGSFVAWGSQDSHESAAAEMCHADLCLCDSAIQGEACFGQPCSFQCSRALRRQLHRLHWIWVNLKLHPANCWFRVVTCMEAPRETDYIMILLVVKCCKHSFLLQNKGPFLSVAFFSFTTVASEEPRLSVIQCSESCSFGSW